MAAEGAPNNPPANIQGKKEKIINAEPVVLTETSGEGNPVIAGRRMPINKLVRGTAIANSTHKNHEYLPPWRLELQFFISKRASTPKINSHINPVRIFAHISCGRLIYPGEESRVMMIDISLM